MKKIAIILMLIITTIFLSGCFKQDTYDDINILTTIYPSEYIISRLYKDHSNTFSIYPDGIGIENYSLTEEQINTMSKNALYIFNGLSNEKNYVIPFLNKNKKMKIIDAAMTMTYKNNISELWLNPSNFLMLAQNIKRGLNEYISNHYLKQEIANNYDKLKIEISSLDAEIKLMADNADYNTIVINNDAFKFLEKYGLNVISIAENDNLNEKTISQVENLIKKGMVKVIFVYQYENESETLQRIRRNTNVELITLKNLATISQEDRSAKKDYISIMKENIESIRSVLYK